MDKLYSAAKNAILFLFVVWIITVFNKTLFSMQSMLVYVMLIILLTELSLRKKPSLVEALSETNSIKNRCYLHEKYAFYISNPRLSNILFFQIYGSIVPLIIISTYSLFLLFFFSTDGAIMTYTNYYDHVSYIEYENLSYRGSVTQFLLTLFISLVLLMIRLVYYNSERTNRLRPLSMLHKNYDDLESSPYIDAEPYKIAKKNLEEIMRELHPDISPEEFY